MGMQDVQAIVHAEKAAPSCQILGSWRGLKLPASKINLRKKPLSDSERLLPSSDRMAAQRMRVAREIRLQPQERKKFLARKMALAGRSASRRMK